MNQVILYLALTCIISIIETHLKNKKNKIQKSALKLHFCVTDLSINLMLIYEIFCNFALLHNIIVNFVLRCHSIESLYLA